MTYLNKAIKFLQDNWALIIILIGSLLVVLKAIADFKVRWAKITPEKEDDIEASLFKAKVSVIIQFIKDIFKLGKNKKGNVKIYFICILSSAAFGSGATAYLLNKKKSEIKSNQEVEKTDKTKESQVRTIVKYRPSKCDNNQQEIASVEEVKTETKNDIEVNSKTILQDNFMADTDFESEIGIRYKPFDNIPFLNKVWLGSDYNKDNNELKLKAAFTTRLNL